MQLLFVAQTRKRTYLDERQPLRHELFAVVHDEHSTNVQLDVVVLFLVGALEHVEWSPLGDKHHCAELKLALCV